MSATDVILRTISFCCYSTDIKIINDVETATTSRSINHRLINPPYINLSAYLLFDAACNTAQCTEVVLKQKK